MPILPLNLVEPRDAVQRVRAEFGCRGDQAVKFLCDGWISGELMPRFIAGEQPGGADPSMADWFAGAIILPDKWLPRRAISEPGDDPEWQRVPGRSFPFKFDRQELEAALRAAHAALNRVEPIQAHAEPRAAGGAAHIGGLPHDAISFANAIHILAPVMGRHYPELEARRALVAAVADERLAGYGRPDRASHYDLIQAWLWPHGRIESDGRGNYDLRFNFNGIPSAWCDIHFSTAEIERLRDYLIPTCAAPQQALLEVSVAAIEPVSLSAEDPPFIPPADRAPSEPGECGCWRDSAEEQEATQTAPEVLAAYRAKMRGLPRLVEERRRCFEGGSLVFVNHDYEAAIKTELRAPMKEHFDRQLRAGSWICYGFSEERGERVRIGSPWRDGLSFDDAGGMTDKRGGRYSDVLFYRASELPRQPISVQPQTVPPNPELSQSEKAKLRRRLKDFLERETGIDPPRARTKAEWLGSARQEFGADAVTENLFEEVWREADLPPMWRAPGRRT